MALLPDRRPPGDSSVALSREELLAMLDPAVAAEYRAARKGLVRAEAAEVLIVLGVVAAIAGVLVGLWVVAPVMLAAAVPAVAVRGAARRGSGRRQEAARAAAEWERPRHRVEVEPGETELAVSVRSCTLDPHGAHRAVVEGGVAMGETATLQTRRVPRGEDVALHEAVAELEAAVDRREEEYRETHAALAFRREEAALDAGALEIVRESSGRWR